MIVWCLLLSSLLAQLLAVSEYKLYNEYGVDMGSLPSHTFGKRDTSDNTITKEDNHTYYTSDTVVNETRWIELEPSKTALPKTMVHEGLSSKFRYAYQIKLPFVFPFYGLPLDIITPTTGGFIYVGDIIHRKLTETQYIAPLMAEFDPSLGNDSYVYYYINDTVAVVQWEKVHIHTDYNHGADDNKPFTFQVQMHKNGDLTFAYREIPYSPENIDSTAHYVKAGVSEAYYQVDNSYGTPVTRIYQYHEVSLPLNQITNNSQTTLHAVKTCYSSKNCADCTTSSSTFNCVWCPTLQQCGDGMSRWKQTWEENGCLKNNIPKQATCPREEDTILPVADKSTGWYEEILCHDSTAVIACPGTKTLTIHKATYGRQGYLGSVCQKTGDIAKPDCDLKTAKDKASEKCTGNTTCAVSASAEWFGEDPCNNFNKVLYVYYTCDGGSSASGVALGLFLFILLSVLVALAVWGVYAYRNPTSPSGLFLIKYGRFWRSSIYKSDPSESGI